MVTFEWIYIFFHVFEISFMSSVPVSGTLNIDRKKNSSTLPHIALATSLQSCSEVAKFWSSPEKSHCRLYFVSGSMKMFPFLLNSNRKYRYNTTWVALSLCQCNYTIFNICMEEGIHERQLSKKVGMQPYNGCYDSHWTVSQKLCFF